MAKLTLYHGTRANPELIRKHGLLAGGLDRDKVDPATQKYVVNKEKTLKRVLAEFNLTKGKVPAWIYRGELEYESDKPIHLHLEMCKENAKGYADMGGEPAYCIRYNLLIWLNKLHKHLASDPRLKELNRQAKLANGPVPYVIKVEIDEEDPRLDPMAKETFTRVRQAIAEGKIKRTFEEFWDHPCEIRYFGDIPPDKILEITPV